MDASALGRRARTVKARVRAMRPRVDMALAEGTADALLIRELEDVEVEERALLAEALPLARERLIGTRDMGGRLEVICPDVSKASESGLPEEVVTLVEQCLGEGAELPEPAFPAGMDVTDGGEKIQGVALRGALWCTVCGGETCFVFTDEGCAYLMEHNLSWRIAREPLAEGAFPTRIVQESPASCLFVDVDGALERLSYARLDTVDALLREPLYA